MGPPGPQADYWYCLKFLDSDGADYWSIWNVDRDGYIGEHVLDFAPEGTIVNIVSSVSLGRMPARNAVEAQDIIRKTTRYLLFPNVYTVPAPEEFYATATIAAGPTNSVTLPAFGGESNGIHFSETDIIPAFEYSGSPWKVWRMYPDVGGPNMTCPGGFQCFAALHDYIAGKFNSWDTYWAGTDLRDRLDAGTHVLFHYDHSSRWQLGGPSCPCTEYSCRVTNNQCGETSSYCCGLLNNHLSSIEGVDANQAMALKAADGAWPRYAFVVSMGSLTAQNDMNTVGEALLRAPDGGAVAYVGNNRSSGNFGQGPSQSVEFLGPFFQGMFGNTDQPKQWAQAWVEAIDSCWNGWSDEASRRIGALCGALQLGDPFLWAWRGAPVGITLSCVPTMIPVGLNSEIRITARGEQAQPIAGVVVCLRQGAWLYLTGITDASGLVRFQGVRVPDSSAPIKISGLQPGRKPSGLTVPVAGGKSVVYLRHEIDDCVTGGDCDSVLEAGERSAVDVTLQNKGMVATMAGTTILRPLVNVEFELKINGQYRPGNTLLGKAGAAAPSEGSRFVVPLTYRGTRIEGEPAAPARGEVFRVWRNEGSGLYTVAMRSRAASQDTVFSGVVRSAGGISGVTKIGEVNDTYSVGADSIAFSFRGDASEDKLTFKAEGESWLTVNTGTGSLAALQPGDSATVRLVLTTLGACPDAQNVYCTVSAWEGAGSSAHSYSDFVLRSVRPEVDVVAVDREFGDFGCPDTSWRWYPTVWNRGGGAADSVVLRLRKRAGQLVVVDSVITFPALARDSVGTGPFFRLCASTVADTAGFVADIVKEVRHKSLLECDVIEGGAVAAEADRIRSKPTWRKDPSSCGGRGCPQQTDTAWRLPRSRSRSCQRFSESSGTRRGGMR